MRWLAAWWWLAAVAVGLECKGLDPCPACKDCSACRYCDPRNPKGGSCGKLRSQEAAAREAAAKKRAARAK